MWNLDIDEEKLGSLGGSVTQLVIQTLSCIRKVVVTAPLKFRSDGCEHTSHLSAFRREDHLAMILDMAQKA